MDNFHGTRNNILSQMIQLLEFRLGFQFGHYKNKGMYKNNHYFVRFLSDDFYHLKSDLFLVILKPIPRVIRYDSIIITYLCWKTMCIDKWLGLCLAETFFCGYFRKQELLGPFIILLLNY